MIVVQKLVTRWTKLSRGGAGAATRNATPKQLPIPRIPHQEGEVLVHLVELGESVSFEARSSVSTTTLATLRNEVSEIDVRLEECALRVQLVWNGWCGAPERARSRAIRISPGRWCRLLHNGRFATHRGWSYQNTILNVGLDVDAMSFDREEPQEVADARARLR